MLKAKNSKIKKYQKRKIKSKKKAVFFIDEIKSTILKIKSVQPSFLSFKQIDSYKYLLLKKVKRNSTRIETKIFPDIARTKKPNEIRMGKGKGPIHFWICKLLEGTTLFEIHGTINKKVYESFLKAAKKLPNKIFAKNVKSFFF